MTYHFLVESKPHERIDLLIITPPLFVQILKTRPPPLILGGEETMIMHTELAHTRILHTNVSFT